MNERTSPHISVMLKEFLSFFQDLAIEVFFDGTVGAGGHAKALLEAHPEIKRYIGCDQDPEALSLTKHLLKPWEKQIALERGNFADLDRFLKKNKVKKVDGFFLISGCRLCN